jgi:D-3-phosphoglycerate dehydrogenase
MKVVLNVEPYGYSETAKKLWRKKGYTYRETSWKKINDTSYFPRVTILIVRLGKYIDKNVLSKFPDLTTLITATTGLDHIDLDDVKLKGIRLVSLRGQTRFLKTLPSTAEMTWALLLALLRKIPQANESVKSRSWNRDKFRGYQLKGKMLGIIGLGRVGSMVARYAHAFGMQICYFDPFVSNTRLKRCRSLNELLKQSDIITLHLHLTETSQNLLNSTNLKMVKSGCFLINTSRGGLLDETAVVSFLKKKHNKSHGKIAGIATDVLTSELVDIKASPLWQAQQRGENIIITPHLGGATWDAMWACEEFIISLI